MDEAVDEAVGVMAATAALMSGLAGLQMDEDEAAAAAAADEAGSMYL